MTDEADARTERTEGREAVLGRYQVIPLVGTGWRRVDQRCVLDFSNQRQRAQPGTRVGVEPLARPLGGRPRVGIEPVELESARHGMLVVAADDLLTALADEIDTGGGIGAVTNDVPQAEDGVAAVGGVGEDGAKRFQVSMDIREDGVPHGRGVRTLRAALCGRDRGSR